MSIYHIHHIIPRHMGGSNHPSNLIELTIEEHADAHLRLWEEHGNQYDLIAYHCLKGQISVSEAKRQAWLIGSAKGASQPKSEKWKQQASERMKKRYADPTERAKVGDKHHGKSVSDAARRAMSVAAKKSFAEGCRVSPTGGGGMTGKTHSAETKQRMREAWEKRRLKPTN